LKEMLIKQLVTVLLSMLSPEMLRKAMDALLDIAEEAVEKSETKVDDSIVLPLCSLIRSTFNIPDED